MATTLVNEQLVDPHPVAPTHLTWSGPDGRPRREPIADGATTIGAGPRCVVRVDILGARPLHCVLQRSPGGVTVRRWSGDTNLNGRSFTESPLRVGDRLMVAGVEISVEGLGPGSEPPASAAPFGVPQTDASSFSAGEQTPAEPAEPPAAIAPPEERVEEEPAGPEPLEAVDWSAALSPPVEPLPPVPAHLLQPWLDAAPEPVDEQTGGDGPTGFPSETPSETSSETSAETLSEPSPDTQGGPADAGASSDGNLIDQPAPATLSDAEARLRAAVRSARDRARQMVRLLRAERASTLEARVAESDYSARQHDLATKLMLATTELDDCRAELDAARRALHTATVEASDRQWLFAAAQQEVDELERRVAELTGERSVLVGQREQLEAAVVALEQRLADNAPVAEPLDAAALDTPATDPSSAAEESWGEGPAVVDAADDSPGVDPGAEQERLVAGDEQVVVDAAATDDAHRPDPSPFPSPAEPAEPAEQSEEANHSLDCGQVAEAVAEASEPTPAPAAPAAEDPWSGAWGIELATPDDPLAPQAESLQTETPTETDPEAAQEPEFGQETKQGVDAWLDSFQTTVADDQSEGRSEEDPLNGANGLPDPLASSVEADLEPTPSDAFPATAAGEETATGGESLQQCEQPEAGPDPVRTVGEGEQQAADRLAAAPSLVDPAVAEAETPAEPDANEPSTHEAEAEQAEAEQAELEQAEVEQAEVEQAEQGGDLGLLSPLLERAGVLRPADADEDDPPATAAAVLPADPTPPAASVDDLILEDQPSGEAPVSFLEKFADTLPADDSPAEPFPTPPPIQQPAFDEPAPSGGPGEESIEDYMAKLMQRMRGDAAPVAESASAPAPVAEPEREASDNATPADDAVVEEAEEVTPIASLDELRSGPAPEQGTDMSTLRALANQTARSAIGVSEVKHDREQATIKLAIAGIAMGCGGFMALTAPSWLDWSLFVGLAGFGWAAYWFHGTLRLRLAARAKEALSYDEERAAAADLPISPEA